MKPLVYVVDDDSDASELIADALAETGVRLRVFDDPLRALGAMNDERVDLLITDLSMPWVDGEGVIQAARVRQPELRVLLVSGYDRGQQLADQEGVAFLRKPVGIDELRRAVKENLGVTRRAV